MNLDVKCFFELILIINEFGFLRIHHNYHVGIFRETRRFRNAAKGLICMEKAKNSHRGVQRALSQELDWLRHYSKKAKTQLRAKRCRSLPGGVHPQVVGFG